MARVNVKDVIRKLSAERSTVQASEVALVAGVTRQTAHSHLRDLVGSGELVREGAGRATRYRRAAGVVRADRGSTRGARIRLRFDLGSLDEDRAWRELATAADLDRLPRRAIDVLHYAVTEIVNNAIDHSAGTEVVVTLDETPRDVIAEIADDGIGIFDHVRRELGLQSRLEAIQELHKGKTTTMPDRHSGEGIFFVSKAVDLFEIDSGGLRWLVDNDRNDVAVLETNERRGTRVVLRVHPDTARNLRSIFDAYTDDLQFAKTHTRVKLFTLRTCFVTRSEARRLMYGLDRFKEVILDFRGVEGVGQGFADEVFRVWATDHPDTRLRPVDMNESVAFFVGRARRRHEG